jgi:hypothetical protein
MRLGRGVGASLVREPSGGPRGWPSSDNCAVRIAAMSAVQLPLPIDLCDLERARTRVPYSQFLWPPGAFVFAQSHNFSYQSVAYF